MKDVTNIFYIKKNSDNTGNIIKTESASKKSAFKSSKKTILNIDDLSICIFL